MSNDDKSDVVESFWPRYAQLQRIADGRRVDARFWAIDELTEEYLDRFAGNRPDLPSLTIDEVNALPNRFPERVVNRKQKYRRRREINLTEFPWKANRPVAHALTPSASAIAEARNGPAERLYLEEKLA